MANFSDPNQFLAKHGAQGPSPGGVLACLLPNQTLTWFPVATLVTNADGSQVSESMLLAGIRMPGQWLLTKGPREFGWEERKGWGMTGATLIPTGDPLLHAEFDIKIWNNLDAYAYRQLLKTVLKKPAYAVIQSSSYTGLGIVQQQLNDVNVSSVVIGTVTPLYNPLVSSGGRGPWTAKCGLIEYRKVIPAIATPTTTYTGNGPPTPSAQDNNDVVTQQAKARFAASGRGLIQAATGNP